VIVFRCPECQERFEVETKYGGRRWRCTSCQASVLIPAKSDEALEPILDAGPHQRLNDDETHTDRPRPGRRRAEAWDDEDRRIAEQWPGWAVTRVGVRVLGTGVSIFLVSWLFLVVAKYIGEGQGPPGLARGPIVPSGILYGALTVFGLAGMVFMTLFITGQAISCQVPGPGAAKGTAIGSLMGSVTSVVVLLVLLLLALTANQGMGPAGAAGTQVLFRVMYWLAIAFGALGLVLYLFFLAAVAHHFRRRALAGTIIFYFVVVLLFVVYFIVLNIVQGPEASALLSGNINNVARVGRAVEITFLVHMGLVGVGLFAILSLAGGAIRKSHLSRARREIELE
jgi:DNA-directed RNA polymerase subunit RPC12/RpoP